MQPVPGGRNRLAVDLVHHVAAGEHAVDVGPRRARLDDDIAVIVQLELALEQLGRGLMADGDERAFDFDPADLAGPLVADVEADQRLRARRRRRTRRPRCPRSP